jgi:hypothetical protein
MASKPEDCKEKMKRILHTLVQANRLPEDDCDVISQQYRKYLEEVVQLKGLVSVTSSQLHAG